MHVSSLAKPFKAAAAASSSPTSHSQRSGSSSSGDFDDDIVISYHDATLRRLDLRTLEEDQWLNDAVIGFAYEILSRQFKHMSFWPPSVVELLCTITKEQAGMGKDEMGQLLPKEEKAAFVPVSDKFGSATGVSSHWTCLYSVKKHTHEHAGIHFDSMKPANEPAGQFTYDALARARGAQAQPLIEGDVPPQANASDCGLYVIFLPFAYLIGHGQESAGVIPPISELQAMASKLTPQRIDVFRGDLRAWLEKWAELPRKRQLKLTSWHDIVKTVGPLNVSL